jgi:hypothetical protein
MTRQSRWRDLRDFRELRIFMAGKALPVSFDWVAGEAAVT